MQRSPNATVITSVYGMTAAAVVIEPIYEMGAGSTPTGSGRRPGALRIVTKALARVLVRLAGWLK
jgi:hypothetical protein